MKAKVKATNEIVDVKPERDGYFIDEANDNPYKFDELEFIEETDEEKKMKMMSNLMTPLFSMPDFNKNEMTKFFIDKHIEVIFKVMADIKETVTDNAERMSTSIVYARAIMAELKGEPLETPKQ